MEETLDTQNEINTLTEDTARKNKERSLQQLDNLIESLISDPSTLKTGNNLAFWISQYSTSISFEKKFNPKRLKKYKRGDVIKVNLGFNIGNELGGLHYCVVLDVNNAMGSGTLTVVPLTSSKHAKVYHSSTVNIGEEIYVTLKKKFEACNKKFSEEASEVIKLKENFSSFNDQQKYEYFSKINKTMEDLKYTEKIAIEIDRMKHGSIALVGQITTISKQRIYAPQTSKDILSNIKISANSLTLIDNKLKELYTKS